MAGRSYLKTEPRSCSVEDALSNAFGEIESLHEEMESWKDGLEEKLSHTPKYEQVSEACDVLENHTDAPDVPEAASDLTVTYGETVNKNKKRGVSRATRLDNAVGALNAVVEAVQARIDDLEEQQEAIRQEAPLGEEKAGGAECAERGPIDDLSEKQTELEQFRDEVQEHIDELDGGVEFPGMYG